jgi:hypothetical protein
MQFSSANKTLPTSSYKLSTSFAAHCLLSGSASHFRVTRIIEYRYLSLSTTYTNSKPAFKIAQVMHGKHVKQCIKRNFSLH